MTQQDMFNALYKALAEGLAKLIRNGLAFTVMTGVIAMLIWVVVYLVQMHEADRMEWKAELIATKQEYAEEVNRLRIEIRECQNNNALLLIQIAELKAGLRR